ncbi:MAG: NAD-dependent protein deacetylase [Arenicellales bacterium]|nr:NAD-dependent protein deacetylase [Arenicellales bacterium]
MHNSLRTHEFMKPPNPRAPLERLIDFVQTNKPLFVLTGAGCSTESGIPDYRDANGAWKHAQPVQYQDFMQRHTTRQRYWARSMLGYPRVANARPNLAHKALAEMERIGLVSTLVTQNVDGLHQKAGQRNVIELHGSLAMTRCMGCGHRFSRKLIQDRLVEVNTAFNQQCPETAPDGDARLEHVDISEFNVPHCNRCNGILKPDVVFFGESVPKRRVMAAFSSLQRSGGMVVVGSSLVIYSGYRFCRFAKTNNIPIAAVNLGYTRADDQFTLKLELNCVEALSELVNTVKHIS